MDADRLRALLKWQAPVHCFQSLGSTNDLCKQMAREGAPMGTLVLADRQTAGRGRAGHAFYSPQGGLYLSLVLPPRARPGQLTTLAAVAARRAVLRITGQSLGIKWVNDLLLEGRKAGGILAEGIAGERGPLCTVLGIGLNTFGNGFPPELQLSAARLKADDPEALAAALVREVWEGQERIPGHMAEYRAHCLSLGQELRFEWRDAYRVGIAREVDEEGALLIDTAEGPVRLLAGEASIRRSDGAYI